jgi:hypothetical protein
LFAGESKGLSNFVPKYAKTSGAEAKKVSDLFKQIDARVVEDKKF